MDIWSFTKFEEQKSYGASSVLEFDTHVRKHNWNIMTDNVYTKAAIPGNLVEIILDKDHKFDVLFGMHHEVYPNIIIGGK